MKKRSAVKDAGQIKENREQSERESQVIRHPVPLLEDEPGDLIAVRHGVQAIALDRLANHRITKCGHGSVKHGVTDTIPLMRHLVTGGSGFLGNLIARRLLERGEQVRVLDLWEDEGRPREIEFVRGDVRDRDSVKKAMHGIEVVHHNAALVPVTKAGKDFWNVNVIGSQIVAEEAAHAGVPNFINMSSSAIFGTTSRCPIRPDTPAAPMEIYGRSKYEGEKKVREVADRTGMSLITIRPRTILGSGRLGIFQILFEWIHENRNVYVIGSGNVQYQFVHAADLMDAYMVALDHRKPGTYNVGADRFGTLRGAIEGVVKHAGSRSKVRSLPKGLAINTLRALDFMGLSPLGPWHYMSYHKELYFDVQGLLDMGWKPRYSNDEMFRESYEWYLAHRGELRDAKGSAHRKPLRQRILRLIKKFS